MYSVFESNGALRQIHGFIPAFVRTLAGAREVAKPGDTIIGWTSGGNARITYRVSDSGKLHRVDRRPS